MQLISMWPVHALPKYHMLSACSHFHDPVSATTGNLLSIWTPVYSEHLISMPWEVQQQLPLSHTPYLQQCTLGHVWPIHVSILTTHTKMYQCVLTHTNIILYEHVPILCPMIPAQTLRVLSELPVHSRRLSADHATYAISIYTKVLGMHFIS